MTTTPVSVDTPQPARGSIQTAMTQQMFDSQMYAASLAYCGLPNNYPRVFKSVQKTDRVTEKLLFKKDGTPDTYLCSCYASSTSKQGYATWVQVNEPHDKTALTKKGYPKKASNNDIAYIRNITLDCEYPPAPEIAHRVGLALAAYCTRIGIAPDNQPVDDSGAGPHIILCIPTIETTQETAERWNKAIRAVVKEHIQPEFMRLVAAEGIEMGLEGFDTSRVLSLPGTWRPTNPAKADCDRLKQGYLRRWLAPYVNGHYPIRQENTHLAELIRSAYEQIQEPPTRAHIKRAFSSADNPSVWLADYARDRVTNDRSASFQSLVNGVWLKYGDKRLIHDLREEINELSGSKYDGRLNVEIERSIGIAVRLPREDRHIGTQAELNKEASTIALQFVLQCLQEDEWGDSLLFAEMFRGQVLYDHSNKEWYLWTKHFWALDTVGAIKYYVSGQLASAYLRAGAELNLQVSAQEAKMGDSEEDKERTKTQLSKLKKTIGTLTERAFRLRSVARNKNVLTFAASHLGMGITGDKWDTNKWLLPVPNGVIDLHTGICRDGKSDDYVRTVCPTIWQGIDAPAPRFGKFLEEIFADRTDDERKSLIGFLRRMFGYGITGEVIEHIFSVLYGEDGRNGKDTLERALSNALGDISTAIHKDVLLEAGRARSTGGATPHLSDLQGRRIAWGSEPERGARFNISQIKELSGGGKIPTRGLFEKKFTKIEPTHLLILLTNHKPQADANDSAFWERLRLITFNIRFVDTPIKDNEKKKDTNLWNDLAAEAPGILAWLVRGCLEWQREGLNTPASVLSDGATYRMEEDAIQQFINEYCVTTNPDAIVRAKSLYEAYKTWCPHGTDILNSTNFGRQFGKKKYQKGEDSKGIYYKGIGLINIPTQQTMDSLEKLSTPLETTPEASLDDYQQASNGQFGQFVQKVSSNALYNTQNTTLSVQTVQTVHNSSTSDAIEQPVEPHQGAMDSLEKTIHFAEKTIHTIQNPDVVRKLQALKKFYEKAGNIKWNGEYLSHDKYFEQLEACLTSGDMVLRTEGLAHLNSKSEGLV